MFISKRDQRNWNHHINRGPIIQGIDYSILFQR